MIQGFMVVGLNRNNKMISTDVYDTQQKAIEGASLNGIIPQFAKVLWVTSDREVSTTMPVVNVEIT